MLDHRIVPYQPADLAEPADLVASIRQRRGGNLLNLDRMLLHSAPYARGWNAFLKEVRENLTVDAQLRELAICAVAVLNGADYEFMHHVPEFVKAGGDPALTEKLRQLGSKYFEAQAYSPIQQQVIELTTQMTRSIQVPRALMESLQASLGDAHLVELVGVISAYNMVSRFLIALQVTPE